MNNEPLEVADQVVVSLEYVLRLDGGDEIERSDSDDPLEYLHGSGNIIPGLETALYGMTLGEEKEVMVRPAQGYGERDPDRVVEFSRNSFPSSVNLAVGEPLTVQDNKTGDSFRATIAEIRPETVLLDFNHPLAGETLNFQVKIAGLRNATEEEISHRHVHQPGGEH
jgi:FKBP-type peptidyl-prolyl cis-trans isomerase SlyD